MVDHIQTQANGTESATNDQVLCSYCGKPASGAEVAAGQCQNCGSFLLNDADLHRFFETLVRELKRDEESR
ncbi:MAG: hypothetical protein ACE5H9_12035 [Anaerolineae bacterium]